MTNHQADPQPAPRFHIVGWLIVRRAGRLLLARRAGVSYHSGHWGLPGGHVEPGETLPMAASREAFEEVGIRTDPDDLVPVGMARYVDGDAAGLDVFFTAEAFDGEPAPVSECDRVGWFGLDGLPDPILPWLPDSLHQYLVDRNWYAESLG
ncbi:NUDIX domain-containing protein [Microlunatus sp. Gsoil 973]|uniref:NUDIX domain-containing protein n=1 Tax=Microlunatus sp. Gsoil 973 TaxID=2672569 RepID=UPI0012B49115|nr:NUDIX domain-containing protein [Microlunatus sp. Gsoil 973]QGN32098.1 NUDIX domain-containing protein [Microlunatus sp. Gsoil 973]